MPTERILSIEQVNSQSLGGRMYLPFGIFTPTINPMTVTVDAYGANIDRTMTPISIGFTFLVSTTNSGVNYWRIDLLVLNSGTVCTFNTKDVGGPDSWLRNIVTTFSISPLTTSHTGVYVECTKINSPGNLFMFGPLFEVSV